MRKFQKKTIKEFQMFLEEMGLSIYGPHMVGNTQYPGCMDYSAEEIVKRRKLFDKDQIDISEDY